MDLLAPLLLQAAAIGNPTHVDQLAVPRSAQPARRLPGEAGRRDQATMVTQVPADLEPVAEPSEETLVAPTPAITPANRAAAEIARAAGVIRDRGQQVTPELLAREVGPDVLETYLANPDAPPATALPVQAQPAAPPPGVTVLPSAGQK